MVRSGEDFLELVWSAREEGVIGRPNQCFACSGAPQGGMWSAQGCKVGTNREQGRGGKWGRGNSMGRMVANSLHSPAGSALTPQGGKWGRSGNAPGRKVERRQLRTHWHPDLDHQGAARGGKWGRSGNAPGWKVGRPEAQRSLLGTALTPGHSTRQQVGHNPITMRTAGHDRGYKSDITPAQHAKTRLRPEVTSTIHDTVFDLWTTQAQGRTYNAHSQNPGFQIRAKLTDGPALANDAPDPQGNSPKNSAGASPSSSEKEPHCLSAKRSRTTHRRPSK